MVEKHLSVGDGVVKMNAVYRVAGHHNWPGELLFIKNKNGRRSINNVLIYRKEAVLYGNQFDERTM
jgi:hypothetical protein